MSTYASSTLYQFSAKDISGQEVNFKQYNGKVLLIVNTASKCGFTRQYASLQELYERYRDQGFEVLAFPANNFANQEPGTDEEIKKFCDLKFKVNFPLFSKISVKGQFMHPLYRYLTEETEFKGSIKWNFTKFLVDKKGDVVARFSPMKDPMSPSVEKEIQKLLKD